MCDGDLLLSWTRLSAYRQISYLTIVVESVRLVDAIAISAMMTTATIAMTVQAAGDIVVFVLVLVVVVVVELVVALVSGA